MLKNLNIKIRLYLLVSLVIACFLVMLFVRTYYLNDIREEVEGIYIGSLEHMADISLLKDQYQYEILNVVNKADRGLVPFAQAMEIIHKAQDKSNSIWSKFLSTSSFISEENSREWQSIKDRVESLKKETDLSIAKLQSSFQNAEQSKKINTIYNEVAPSIEQLNNAFDDFFQLYIKEANHDYVELQQSLHYFQVSTYALELATLLIIIIFSYLIIQSIVEPLRFAVEHVNYLANGDISQEIKLVTGGEPGVLLQTFNQMMKKMRGMIGDLKEGVTALTSSSQEMTASISQLSSGATETAAAVSETSATTEELKQTVHVSTEKAKDVLASVEATLQTVKTSEQSVLATIDGMNQINDRMQVISDGILKLSEKSLAIGEIMNTMNDLAEQSNLLAVNAAIEATKAGEQGRSFGVVAQEIRTLAEQSKNATVQVRTLLNEIQSATNAAVLATEQGSKSVAKGVERSNKTNEAIKVVVGNMANVSQAANQIVISSQQQLIGVDQVNSAIVNINEATNQIVDQLGQFKTAITSLNQVGSSIQDMVNQYKLTNDDRSYRTSKFDKKI